MSKYILNVLDRERQSLLRERIRIVESITEFANQETEDSLFKLDFIIEEIEDGRKIIEEINAAK